MKLIKFPSTKEKLAWYKKRLKEANKKNRMWEKLFIDILIVAGDCPHTTFEPFLNKLKQHDIIKQIKNEFDKRRKK